jgi:biotin-(acetyl-CoA carboxylase) ligase
VAFAEYLLVGVGVNVRHAPDVPAFGAQRGRAATCLGAHGADTSTAAVQALAAAVATGLAAWLRDGDDSADAVRADWNALVDWAQPYVLREEGSEVQPLRLEDDGQLTVRTKDGAERKLAAEYLF